MSKGSGSDDGDCGDGGGGGGSKGGGSKGGGAPVTQSSGGSQPGPKYALIEVPNHTSEAPGETRVMKTFLRMGTFDRLAPGMGLIQAAESFIDDTRDRGENHQSPQQPNGAPGHVLDQAQRAAETGRLRTRGGWQDHSDGNRVSTTIGDKLEIIRGNYKLMVLGRQDDLDNAAGFDCSGSITEGVDRYPPGYTEYKWVKSYDGNWKITELSEKGDVHEIYHGDKLEEFYGNKMESIVGSPTAVAVPGSTETPNTTKLNPAIIERTWARSILSETGSSAVPVPTITETTFVGAQTSTTNATAITDATTTGALTETTNVTGTLKSETVAGTIEEYTGTATSKITNLKSWTYATTVTEYTEVGASAAATTAGTLNEGTFVGVMTDTTVAGAVVELNAIGAHVMLQASAIHIDVEFAAVRLEIKGGLFFFEMEFAPMYIEFFLGIKMELSVSKEAKWKPSSKEIVWEKSIGLGEAT